MSDVDCVGCGEITPEDSVFYWQEEPYCEDCALKICTFPDCGCYSERVCPAGESNRAAKMLLNEEFMT